MSARNLALLCVLLTPLAGAAQPRLDADGDPLPPGALFRLGSARWRHDSDIGDLACTRDGKWVVALSQNEVGIWDTANGKRVSSIPVSKSDTWRKLALAPHDRRVAFKEDGAVVICDLPDGKTRLALKRPEGQHYCLAFSPDGKTLATSTYKQLLLWDAITGKLLVKVDNDGWGEWAAFTPDGKSLFSSRYLDREHRVVRIDPATGESEVLAGLEKESCRSFALSPDCKTLAVCVAPPGKEDWKQVLLLVDVASGRVHHRLPFDGAQYPSLAFSPDGTTVAMVVSNGLIVCDVPTGKTQTYAEWSHSFLWGPPAFAPDGKTLYARMNQRIRRWSLPELKEIDPVDEQTGAVVLRYSPSGSVLFAAHDTGPIRLWDLSNGKLVHEIPKQLDFSRHTAFTPDGRAVVASFTQRVGFGPRHLAPKEDPKGISSWDVKTGKLSRGRGTDDFGYIAVSADASLLAPALEDEVEVWDRVKDRKIASFPRPKDLPRNGTQRTYSMAFSPDGQRIALIRETKSIVLWDYRAGSQLKLEQSEQVSNNIDAQFSPDGLLFCVTELGKQVLWDATTGQHIADVSQYYGAIMRFTRDSRGLVMLDPSRETRGSKLKLYDLAEGKFVREMAVGQSGSFALSPDHKTLTTAQTNGSLLVWDATPLLKPLPHDVAALGEKEMVELWEDLGGDDARQALEARWKLARAKGVVKFLRGRLALEAIPSGEEIAASIAALDDDRFEVRERVMRRLEQWGHLAEPALKRALAADPPLEPRRRMERLIARLAVLAEGVEHARALRGIAILEASGDAEARAGLRSLADGVKESRPAAAARNALKRLGDD